MLKTYFPTEIPDILQSFLGCKIVEVRRFLFKDEYNRLPSDSKDESSDGLTVFKLESGQYFFVVPVTENAGIKIGLGNVTNQSDLSFEKDVTENLFWKERLGVLKKIEVLSEPQNNNEFALQLVFENHKKAVIQYIDNDNFFDSLIVSENCLLP